MKLLVQSDDYGITEACAHGCIKGIRDGIIRNTGLFVNMPWAAKCVEWIQSDLNNIAFGIDLNISTGVPVLPGHEIPGLVQKNGSFLTSRMHRALDTDENNHDHLEYEQVYREYEAQIQKFILMVGKKPDYIHGHAYGTKTTHRAMLDLAQKYDVILSSDVLHSEKVNAPGMDWYTNPPTLENQLNNNLEHYIVEDRAGFLNSKWGMLITHCGYVDSALMDLSSFNLLRMKDLEALTSTNVLEFIHSHNIELVTYKDLTNEIYGVKRCQ